MKNNRGHWILKKASQLKEKVGRRNTLQGDQSYLITLCCAGMGMPKFCGWDWLGSHWEQDTGHSVFSSLSHVIDTAAWSPNQGSKSRGWWLYVWVSSSQRSLWMQNLGASDFLRNSFLSKPGRGCWQGITFIKYLMGPGLKVLHVESFNFHKNLYEVVSSASVELAKKLRFREDIILPNVTQLVKVQVWNWTQAICIQLSKALQLTRSSPWKVIWGDVDEVSKSTSESTFSLDHCISLLLS